MKKDDYGENYGQHFLEQYKLYVEMADRISIRRENTNRLYIALLSALLAFFSLTLRLNISIFVDLRATNSILFLSVSVLGIALCFLWYINIRSYRQLNTGKFKIILEMEKYLPFPCYGKEWEILGEGKESRKYLQLTRVEKYIPIILSIPYFLLLIYFLTKIICGF